MRALAAGLLVLLTACGGPDPAPSAPPEPAQAQGCPERAEAGQVPQPPTADTGGRLVPVAPPRAVLVCLYHDAGDRLGRAELTTGGLDRVPADLLLPRAFPGQEPLCEPGRPLLARLDYADGAVWVAADEDACTTTNGELTSLVGVGDVLAASAQTGDWTVPTPADADQRCGPVRPGRAGQEGALVPGEPVSLQVCRVDGQGVTRRPGTAAELARVRTLLADPVAQPSDGSCRATAGTELLLGYASGPPVLVTVRPGCRPQLDNGSLSAELTAAQLAALPQG